MPVETEQDKVRESENASGGASPWKVILFNCDCHSFDDVERQLMKAIHCSLARARDFAWEVHSQGSAAVYSGARERCEAVAAVLEDIRLVVKVTQ